MTKRRRPDPTGEERAAAFARALALLLGLAVLALALFGLSRKR